MELVAFLKDMQKRLFGLTLKELRRWMNQLMEQSNCNHIFNKDTEMVGEAFAQCFITLHSDLRLQKPEFTSVTCAMSSSIDLLIKVIDENNLTAARIYNTVNRGVTVVPKLYSKVIA